MCEDTSWGFDKKDLTVQKLQQGSLTSFLEEESQSPVLQRHGITQNIKHKQENEMKAKYAGTEF